MRELVRSSLVAAAIAVAVAVVVGLIVQMGVSGTAMFALIMAVIAFVGTLAISWVLARSGSKAPPAE